MSNTFKNLQIMQNNLRQMHLKLLQKKQKKTAETNNNTNSKIRFKLQC